MTETEVRDLLDKLQSLMATTKETAVSGLSEITAYIIDRKLDIDELKQVVYEMKQDAFNELIRSEMRIERKEKKAAH